MSCPAELDLQANLTIQIFVNSGYILHFPRSSIASRWCRTSALQHLSAIGLVDLGQPAIGTEEGMDSVLGDKIVLKIFAERYLLQHYPC